MICDIQVADCVSLLVNFLFFFFKQKTAYEMRISDWSSDVCSSDLQAGVRQHGLALLACHPATLCANIKGLRCKRPGKHTAFPCMIMEKIGRASCRERVCQYV